MFTTSDPPNIRISILQIFVFVIEGGQENIFLLVENIFWTNEKMFSCPPSITKTKIWRIGIRIFGGSDVVNKLIGAFWPFSWTEVKKQRVMFRSNTYHTDKTLMKTSSLSFYLSFHFIRKMTSGNCAHCIFLSHRRPYFRSW